MIERIEGLGPVEKGGKIQKGSGADFSKALKEALEKVNDLQKRAEKLSDDFAQGKISNIHEVIIEAEKASIALRLTVEVRNRIVEAYRDIMRMQI
ncbi:flagellar hook-basal body complex protein FliE [Thermotoga sp. KOL6]|uniref:flagellar hook-basal body complex protein FliE n=1 Tax=Thermotoga sp. KOL6 TaxID=126741 RepID=UPI000C764C2C|nr:flagellar hook-basal body complex protein FliE [Thermotoga sp. KOL6]PLV60018.1 flagellar hook-basal body protein FliE [Thermotoga sp. KOL6]